MRLHRGSRNEKKDAARLPPSSPAKVDRSTDGPYPGVQMRSMRPCILVLGLLAGREIANASERAGGLFLQGGPSGAAKRPEKRAIGRLGAGLQMGGFYDLGDPGIELRGWARRLGLSVSLGRHVADPSEPGFTEVSSQAGQQFTAGVLLAFTDPRAGRKVPVKLYGTAGILHTTQARGRFERATPSRDGTLGEAVVEGGTGTGSFAGVGAEIGFAAVPGLAVGSELLVALGGGEGWGPGVRFAVRYYVW
jgi:hypothetical protein